VPLQAKVWIKNIRVLWKGPWRPAHFWATLNHIADQLRHLEGGRRVPLNATVHVYRSLKDARDNNAIAHVSWLEDDHPATEQLRMLMKWPKATHWARFRFHGISAVDSLQEPLVPEENDAIFLAKAEAIWSNFDAVYVDVKNSLTSDLRISDSRHSQLEKLFHEFEDAVANKLGRPSPQFGVLDRMLEQYSFVLFGVFTWLKGKDGVSEIRRKRCLRQNLELAEGHFRAFQPLAKLLRDG